MIPCLISPIKESLGFIGRPGASPSAMKGGAAFSRLWKINRRGLIGIKSV